MCPDVTVILGLPYSAKKLITSTHLRFYFLVDPWFSYFLPVECFGGNVLLHEVCDYCAEFVPLTLGN